MECTGKHAKSVGANIRRSQEAAFKDVNKIFFNFC